MASQSINIRTDKFTKQEMGVIEDCIKEWNYQWIVEIVYVGQGNDEYLDVSFTLEQEDLGEFLSLIFACGHEFAYSR